MNQILGAYLLKNTTGFKVDVHQPDVEINVEIREKATYIMSLLFEVQAGYLSAQEEKHFCSSLVELIAQLLVI